MGTLARRATPLLFALVACNTSPSPPPRPPAPPSYITELWRTEARGPVVSTPAGLVLAQRGEELVALDALGGGRVLGARLEVVNRVFARDEQHLVVRGEHHLVAFDPATLAPRWRFECPAGYCGLRIREAGPRFVAAGNIVVPGLGTGVLALDAATGRELWRTTIALDTLQTQFVADEERAILISPGSLLAFDTRTGERQWTRTLPLGHTFSHGALVVLRGRVAAFAHPDATVHVIDATDGRDRSRVPFKDTITDMALDVTSLYIVGKRRLLAFDMARHAVRFDRPLDGFAAPPALALDASIGWLRTAQDEFEANNHRADRVLAFDVATGATVAERDLGEITSMGIARGASGQGVLVADVPGDRVVALALGSRPEPDHEAEVLVRVLVPPPHPRGDPSPLLRGLHVRLGATNLETAEDGTVRHRARGIGVARVDLVDFWRFATVLECPRPVIAFLDFGTRRPSYEIDLVVRPGHCK